MKIIVTGGAGFIGSAFIRYIINNTEHSVLNIDKLTYSSNLDSLESVSQNHRYEFREVDICDSESIYKAMQEYKPSALVNFAAESHVDKSIDAPEIFLQTNVIGTYQLLQSSLKYFKYFDYSSRDDFVYHHISTDEVFGDIKENDLPANESAKYSPNSPYSSSKAGSDHLVNAWHSTYKLPTLITNCTNNYGYFQHLEKLIPLMIFKAINKLPMPIYGDGMQIRDWLYVDDHVKGILLVLEKGSIGESYNIAGGNQISNIDVVKTICKTLVDFDKKQNNAYFDYESLITYVKDRPGHDRRYALNSRKISSKLGWFPDHGFEDGIKKTILWYIDNYELYKDKLDSLKRQGSL